MNTTKCNRRRGLAAVSGAALLAAMTLTPAHAGEVVINNFDDPSEVVPYVWASWSVLTEIGFDTQNAGGGLPGSGSMRVTNEFPNNPGGYNQCVFYGPLPSGQVNAAALYTNLDLDVKLDPLSYPRATAIDYGLMEVYLLNAGGWTWEKVGDLRFTNFNWVHYSFPVPSTADQAHHLLFKLGENNLTNTVIYNVDNIRWIERALMVPPPTMAIEKTKPGLNLLAASAGQYDRQNIATVDSTFGWIGSNAPMSYAMTIKEFPDGVTHAGFSAHFYLVPGTPGTEEFPDWTEPTCALIAIHANTNGTATSEFHYKTNAPNSNGINNQYFNANPTNGPVGWIGNVTNANILGTWTVTMNQNTNITLTAPDGTTSSFVMPPEDAAQFAGSLTVYFGIMTGELPNIGQRAILSRAQISSGATVLVDDNFSTEPLNSAIWVVRAASAAGVSLITPSEPYYLYWTTPATGFTLQTNATLVDTNGWGDPMLTDQLVGTRRRVLVPTTALPAADKGFFRLIKP